MNQQKEENIENISQSIFMKEWGQARIELKTPGSAIRHATDCAMGPGIMLLLPSSESLSKLFFQSIL